LIGAVVGGIFGVIAMVPAVLLIKRRCGPTPKHNSKNYIRKEIPFDRNEEVKVVEDKGKTEDINNTSLNKI
jgi:hypothetical protein